MLRSCAQLIWPEDGAILLVHTSISAIRRENVRDCNHADLKYHLCPSYQRASDTRVSPSSRPSGPS